jgi:hypothetical protein
MSFKRYGNRQQTSKQTNKKIINKQTDKQTTKRNKKHKTRTRESRLMRTSLVHLENE